MFVDNTYGPLDIINIDCHESLFITHYRYMHMTWSIACTLYDSGAYCNDAYTKLQVSV